MQGCPRNRTRVSAESCKGVRGIVKGCPQNRERYPRICRRASAQSQSSKASAESYCIPRIVEGQSACSSRKGGIVVALLHVVVDCQRQRAKPSEPTYVTYLRGSRGSEEKDFLLNLCLPVPLCCYVSVIKPLLLLATSAKLVRHFRIQ